MATNHHSIETALQTMEVWLERPRSIYQAEVYRFAERLPPEEELEAVKIAQAKFPDGGLRGVKYFCGVFHRKLDNQKIRRAWDTTNPETGLSPSPPRQS